MPTLIKIGNLKIQIFADDHNPPHFHVVTPDYEALIRISNFEVMTGNIDRRTLAAAIDWASDNKRILEDEWKRLNS